MRLFKKIDAWIQLVLIIAGVAIIPAGFFYFVYAYIAVGSWQVLSTVIHLFAKNSFFPSASRNAYNIVLLCLAFLGGISALVDEFVFFLMILMLIAALMAFWYLWICHEENEQLKHKAFIHLK
jgi:hypothetical protein